MSLNPQAFAYYILHIRAFHESCQPPNRPLLEQGPQPPRNPARKPTVKCDGSRRPFISTNVFCCPAWRGSYIHTDYSRQYRGLENTIISVDAFKAMACAIPSSCYFWSCLLIFVVLFLPPPIMLLSTSVPFTHVRVPSFRPLRSRIVNERETKHQEKRRHSSLIKHVPSKT